MYRNHWALGNCPAKPDREARKTCDSEELIFEVITRPSGETIEMEFTSGE
jgi:hypothetical protein